MLNGRRSEQMYIDKGQNFQFEQTANEINLMKAHVHRLLFKLNLDFWIWYDILDVWRCCYWKGDSSHSGAYFEHSEHVENIKSVVRDANIKWDSVHS